MANKKDRFEQMNRLLRTYMANLQHFYISLSPQLALTPQQARTLLYIEKHPGLIQREIGDYFHLRNASVTSMLKNLERDGYIVRQNDQESARIKRIFLTAAGKTKTAKIKEVFDQAYAQIVARLREEDINAMIAAMKKINQDLKKVKLPVDS